MTLSSSLTACVAVAIVSSSLGVSDFERKPQCLTRIFALSMLKVNGEVHAGTWGLVARILKSPEVPPVICNDINPRGLRHRAYIDMKTKDMSEERRALGAQKRG